MPVTTAVSSFVGRRAAEVGRILAAVGLGVVLTQWHDTVVEHVAFLNPVSTFGVLAIVVGLIALERGNRWERREANRLAEHRHQEVLNAVESGVERVLESVGPTTAQGVQARASIGAIGPQGPSMSRDLDLHLPPKLEGKFKGPGTQGTQGSQSSK